jgi:hypothetical protein
LGAIGGHFVRTEAGKQSVPVIVRDKRKAFAQGSKATGNPSLGEMDCFATLAMTNTTKKAPAGAFSELR